MNSLQIKTLFWDKASLAEKTAALTRPTTVRDQAFSEKVKTIIDQVKTGGDQTLFELTQKFDRVSLKDLKVNTLEFQNAEKEVSENLRKAIETAIQNIRIFHEAERPKDIDLETKKGVRCERRFKAIERVGLYIPGGTAPLLSTVMMLGVPSLLAGCKLRILATPPRADGNIDPAILVTAKLLGITEIYKIGGAQAIAALAFGTESVPKVDKIFGPGNAWVTEAKLQVSLDSNGAAYDLPAGPSEVLVIADALATPSFIAADLLAQAEHGSDSQVIFITDSEVQLKKVVQEIALQLERLPRKELAAQALEKSSFIFVSNLNEAMEISNHYAPEHLILQTENARKYAELVQNAGSVFIGEWTPESVGDYASGTNHVLPTYGFARAYSGVSLESFMKTITFQELSREGLQNLGPTVEILASAEQLQAHQNAVSIRLGQA